MDLSDPLEQPRRRRVASSPLVVQKFGGSSLATPELVGRVADKIAATRATGQRLCVVVSAMGKTTDWLVGLASEVSGAPPPRELDVLLSAGERISRSVMAMALAARGVPAVSMSGLECGIWTDGPHTSARIARIEPDRVHAALDGGHVVIAAGFQGANAEGAVTTLGRGGSDTTAVALAAALGATRCEIYSDVDGVYTADPRVCRAARRLGHVGYDAMEELARQGAKVLHERAIGHARSARLVVHARATFGGAHHTEIGPGDSRADAGSFGVVGVTGRRCLLRARAASAERAMAVRGALGGEVPVVATRVRDDRRVDVWASGLEVPDHDALAARLREALGEGVEIATGKGSVALVGVRHGELAAARSAMETELAAHGIGCEATLVDGHAVVGLLEATDVDRAVVALHARMIEGAEPEARTWAG